MLVTASIYSIFQPLTDVFETVLKFFHSGGISWGFSIVLLTIAVRAVLIPLTLRQIKSMVRMQTLAPQMKEIQKKYKEDKQRQQQEMMKFYKANNVNPLGSCLPMVLQLPAFFALYAMLRQSLRGDICPQVQRAHNHGVLSTAHTVACGNAPGAHFLFIPDLTNKATGITLVILILLYVGSQLGSSVLMSAASMDPTQRKIMMFMPIIFVLFVIRFPAGLLVYWITTNLWTIAQQYVVKRRIGPATAAVATAGGAGVAGGGSGPPELAAAGDDSSGGGGLGATLRGRLRAAQEAAGASNASRGGERTSSRGGGGSATKTRTSGGNGAAATKGNGAAATKGNGAAATKGNGAGATKGGGAATPGNGGGSSGGGRGAGSKRRGSKSAGANGGSGASSGSGGSNGGGTGNASSGRAGSPPPRPPRKKKKRSGRRR